MPDPADVPADVVPGTSVARRDEILNPLTGELVAWTDAAGVADVLGVLRDRKRAINDAIRVCEAALIDESERRGTKTLHLAGPVPKATVGGGHEIEWDVTVLEELVAAGLPEERYADLVQIVQTFKVDGSVARQIEGANPVYAEIIDRARTRIPKPRRVTLA